MHNFDLIIYHGPCFDGFTAAWIARGLFPDAVMHRTGYGKDPPDVTGRTVLIADFSYPPHVLLTMADAAKHITVLDHHKTAAEALGSLVGLRSDLEIVFDMERSGAGITWDYLHPGQERTPLVAHVEDRDLWRFALEDTPAFHAAMACREFEFSAWDELAVIETAELVAQGRGALAFMQQAARRIAGRAVVGVLPDGTSCWIVNVTVDLVSETGRAVLDTLCPKMPFMGWSHNGHGNVYHCSLRSWDGGPDVSEVAKKFGGGGHRNAAAFVTQDPPSSWCLAQQLKEI